jgi:hypothetical protein
LFDIWDLEFVILIGASLGPDSSTRKALRRRHKRHWYYLISNLIILAAFQAGGWAET